MSTINLPLLACEEYMRDNNKSLFTLLSLPDGIDKDTLVNNILLQGAEFEVLYPNPDFLQSAIGLWSQKMYSTFEKWIYALQQEFNPIENYDRYEEYTKSNTGTVSDQGSSSNTGTIKNTGTQSDSGSTSNTGTQTNSGSNSSSNKVSAFNSDTMRDNTSSSETASSTRTDNLASTANNTRTDDLTQTNNLNQSNNNTRTDNLQEHNISHIHGNIGVTTSTAMIKEFNQTYLLLNIYNQITDLFITEFCLMVY